MQVGACEGILFSLPQNVHYFVCGIQMQDWAEGAQISPLLSSFAIWSLKVLNWVVGGWLNECHYEFWIDVVRGIPAY